MTIRVVKTGAGIRVKLSSNTSKAVETSTPVAPVHPRQAEPDRRDVLAESFWKLNAQWASKAPMTYKPAQQDDETELDDVAGVDNQADTETIVASPDAATEEKGVSRSITPVEGKSRESAPSAGQSTPTAIGQESQPDNSTANPENPKIKPYDRSSGLQRIPKQLPKIKPAIRPSAAVDKSVTQVSENPEPVKADTMATQEVAVPEKLQVEVLVSDLPESEGSAADEQPQPAVRAEANPSNPTLNPDKTKFSGYRNGVTGGPTIRPANRPAVTKSITPAPENLESVQANAMTTPEVGVPDKLQVEVLAPDLPKSEGPATDEQPQSAEPTDHPEEVIRAVAESPTLVGETIIVAAPSAADAVFPGTQSAATQAVEAAFAAHKQGAFTVGEDCLTYEDEKETVQVTATRIHVAFMCSEASGKGHGFCLTWLNRNGKECSKVITMPRLVSDWNPLLGELGDEGLFILSPRHLKLYLLETCSRATLPEVRLITEIGFFPLNPDDPDGAYGFMLPSGAILPVDAGLGQVKASELRYRAPFEHKALGAYQVAGTHEEWKAGVAPAEGNALVVFCTCAVLGSVMLKVYGGENCGFHLYGLSSTGKSTAAQVGMSVLGCAADPQSSSKPTIFGSWSATDNGREIMAACASGAAILMDELDSCPKGASVTVYPIMNGVGKVRMRGTGSMAQQHTWRLLALSTGELSLYERIMREPQREAMLGELSRFLDIPVDNLPRNGALTVEQAQALALQLKKRSGEFYGSACVAFVQWLFAQYPTQGLLRTALLQAIDTAQSELIAHLAPRRHLRPAHKRAIRHFALVLAVGRWAADGVLPFSVAAIERAVFVMVEAWSDNFPSLTDEDRVLDGFRAYMRDQRDVVVCTDSATEEGQRGRAPKILLHEGRLYLAPECFHQACGEMPVVKVGKILDRLGILHRHGTDGQKVKMTMWPSLFRNQRYYALDADHLLGERELAELMGGTTESAPADLYDEDDLGEIPQF